MRLNTSTRRSRLALAVVSLALVAGGTSAQLISEGQTTQSRPFVSGGASIEDARALEQQRKEYRLWLVTAAAGSGAWLAGAQTVVRDSRGAVVLETVLNGPYLMVDLAPGRYTIDVTLEGQRRTETVSVGSSGTRQVVLYFESPAEISPDMPDRSIAKPGGSSPDSAPSPR